MHKFIVRRSYTGSSIVNQAREDGVPVKARFLINPGSEQIRYTAERDGILKIFEDAGATVIANACGPPVLASGNVTT